MDFILTSQANAVIRMEQWDEKLDELREDLVSLHAEVRATSKDVRLLVRENRQHQKRIRLLERSQRQRDNRYEGIKDVVKILVRLTAGYSKRLDRLENKAG